MSRDDIISRVSSGGKGTLVSLDDFFHTFFNQCLLKAAVAVEGDD